MLHRMSMAATTVSSHSSEASKKGGVMMGINVPNQVPFANGNFPYLEVTNITVGTTAVDLAMGYRRVPATGILLIRIPQTIPAGTTETLPVTLTLNGNTRQLTFFGGGNVTVADVAGTGVLQVFNDKFNGILQLLSTPAPATT